MGASLAGNLSDIQVAQLSLQQLYEAVCTNPFDTSLMQFETELFWQKSADDASANTTTAEFVLQWMPRRATLSLAANSANGVGPSTYVPATATGLTAVAANFATLILNSRASNGANVAVMSTTNSTPTANGGTGNWAQWVPVPLLNVTPFNGVANGVTTNGIPANGFLTAQITKGGAGVIVPGGTLTARVQYI